MFDLCLICIDKNKDEIQNLQKELNLLGMRTITEELDFKNDIKNQLEEKLNRSASILLLINNTLGNKIVEEKISCQGYKSQICIVYFSVKSELRKKINKTIFDIYQPKSRSIKNLAREITKTILSDEQRDIKFTPSKSINEIWKSPIYIFKKEGDFEEIIEVLVDVTWSAKPTRPEIAPSLKSSLSLTLKKISESEKRNKETIKILDFGAGKLRHSVFLLEKGYSVTAVDYENLFINPTDHVKENLDKTNQAEYENTFQKIVYPSQLITAHNEHDLVILVNVLGIMPEPIERLFVLDQCYKKLKKSGYILLFNQHGDTDQIKAVSNMRITDGGCTTKKGRKTFYKDFNTQEELINLFALAGFEEEKEIKFNPSNNHILLFKKREKQIINIEHIVETERPILERKIYIGQTESEIAIADVLDSDRHLKFGAILNFCLTLVKEGKKDAYKYEDLVVLILKYVFKEYLKTPEIEKQYESENGRQRIDIKANWKNSNINNLRDIIINEHGLKSSYIPIECKNYSNDLANPEYGQIVDRCSKRHRHFAIIICRKNQDRDKVIEQCFDRWHNHEYLIIVLDDQDLNKLLIYADNQEQDQILNHINKKIEEVRDRKK